MGALRWAEFEVAAPELAARGRALIERFGFVLAGTIRADGTPRISPVAAHLAGGELMLVMIPGTQKARDVLRDPRIVLQSPVTEAAEPGAEFKLRGHAAKATSEALRAATADTIETVSGWRPPRTWLYLAVAVQAAAHLAWTGEDMTLTRWDGDHGLRGPERRRLDPDAGTYRGQAT
jgi:Pyridoxamine 5'-phosphate oxidase